MPYNEGIYDLNTGKVFPLVFPDEQPFVCSIFQLNGSVRC